MSVLDAGKTRREEALDRMGQELDDDDDDDDDDEGWRRV
jgi:hypothetical protein